MRKPIRIQGITFISVLSCMLAVPILRQPAAAQRLFGAIVRTFTDITVSAQSSRIETETAKLSDVRTTMQLRELPLADRSVYRFLVLTPGVTGGGADGTMSVSGSRQRQEHYAVDGVTMSDVRSSN